MNQYDDFTGLVLLTDIDGTLLPEACIEVFSIAAPRTGPSSGVWPSRYLYEYQTGSDHQERYYGSGYQSDIIDGQTT